MKRFVVFLAILGLLAGSIATAEAGKKKKPKRVERVAEVRYETPAAIGIGGVGGACSGCPGIPNATNETWMKVEIVDDALPVAGVELSPGDLDGDGFYDSGWFICGESEWIQVPGGSEMQSFPWVISGAECPGGGATSGTI
ncbi:MAG: hypothetical protein ACRD1T_24505, partial [Acidimicrobiia bacterium]